MAQAYAATQPSDALWRKYLKEIDKLRDARQVSPDEYYVLRYTLEAREGVMIVTGGDSDAFSEGTVTEVLERARENVKSEIRAEYEESDRVRREEIEALRVELAGVHEEIGSIKARDEKRARRNERVASRLALIITRFVGAGVVVGLIVGMVTSVWGLPTSGSAWYRYLLFSLQLLVVGVTVWNVVFGDYIGRVARRAEVKLATLIRNTLKSSRDL